MSKAHTLERQPAARLDTPTDLSAAAMREISAALNALLADAFALYLKTKNFHWHVSGPHFRDYHLLLDEQSAQIFATTDVLAERVRKIGGTTLRSVGDVARQQSTKENDAQFVAPNDMLRELMEDNKAMAAAMRGGHGVAEKHADVATAGLFEPSSMQPKSAPGSCSRRVRPPISQGADELTHPRSAPAAATSRLSGVAFPPDAAAWRRAVAWSACAGQAARRPRG
jgi:starvation-inducible DNA-binding protein